MSVPESARRRFMASLDGLTFQPWETPIVDEAANTFATLEALRSIDEPSLAVLREIRGQQETLRRLLGSVGWPEEGQGGNTRSHAGRQLAKARWNG